RRDRAAAKLPAQPLRARASPGAGLSGPRGRRRETPCRARAEAPRNFDPPTASTRKTLRESLAYSAATRAATLNARPGIRLHSHPDILAAGSGPDCTRNDLARGS